MKVEWTGPAVDMLEEIADFIAQTSPDAAATVTRRLYDAVTSLTTFLDRARPGQHLPGTRELVVRPYLVIFRVRGQAVQILAIVDGRRGDIEGFIIDRLSGTDVSDP